MALPSSESESAFPFPSEGGGSRGPSPLDEPPNDVTVRYPSAKIASEAALDESTPLQITIGVHQADPNGPRMELPHSPGEKDLPVDVIIDVDHNTFAFPENEKHHTTLLVPVEPKDSKSFIFHLIPKQAGDQIIQIRFYYKQSEVAVLTVHTHVNAKGQFAESKATQEVRGASLNQALTRNMPPGPDLTLYVLGADSEFSVYLNQEGKSMVEIEPPIKFSPKAEAIVSDLIDFIERDKSPAKIREDRIKGIGKQLYNELFPNSLKNLYWEMKREADDPNKLKSIRIITKETIIPWEIIKPYRKKEDGQMEEDLFLCEQFSFSRWVMGSTDEKLEEVRRLPIGRIKVVVPSDTNLTGAKEERDWISNRFKPHVTLDESYDQFIRSLQDGGFDILHVSTHGHFNANNPMRSSIEMNKVQSSPDAEPKPIEVYIFDISGLTEGFGRDNPVVILNACQTGVQGSSLVGIESWAKKFLEVGAPVFIGTQWSVNDKVAFLFAKNLYNELAAGRTIGEAVRNARNHSKLSGDQSWLAYQLYGHPNSTIDLKPLIQS